MDYAKVLKLPQYFRNLQRLSEILAVLVKHGFGDLVNRFNIFSYGETRLKLANPSLFLETQSRSLAPSTRLRLVCEELGPTFIKLGQLISTRPDAFPESIIAEFRKLRDKVPPFPTDAAVQILEKELRAPVTQLFRRFEDEPLAAGSIAQVHRAQLSTGEEVVVKIRRPYIERTIDTDMDIVRGLASLLEENIPELATMNPSALVDEFDRTMKRECDFRKEAHYMTRFAAQHQATTDLIVPRTYPRLCTARVLTQEYIEGCKIEQFKEGPLRAVQGPALARALTKVVLDSIFQHRFFHADPHSGNVLITPAGRIALIDYGEMGRIDRQRMYVILQFIAATFERSPERMLHILREAQIAPASVDEAGAHVQIAEILDTYLGKSLGSLDLSKMLTEVFEVVRRYGIRPPADVLMIAKALTTLESIGAALDPSFDPVQVIAPYVTRRYLAYRVDPHIRLERTRDLLESYQRLAAEFPKAIRTIGAQLSSGRFTIQTVERDFVAVKEHQNRMLNRAILAVVGVTLSCIGLLLLGWGADTTKAASYILIAVGMVCLVRTWLAIRRSGGV